MIQVLKDTLPRGFAVFSFILAPLLVLLAPVLLTTQAVSAPSIPLSPVKILNAPGAVDASSSPAIPAERGSTADSLAAAGSDPITDVPVQSIKSLRADSNSDDTLDLLDQKVTIRGRASVGSSVLADPYLMIYLQDETAGVMVFTREWDQPVNRGDSLVVTGTLKLFKGTPEIVADHYQVIETQPRVPDPLPLEQAFKEPQQHFGRLVSGEAVVIQKDFETDAAMLRIAPVDSSQQALYAFVSRSNVHFNEFDFDMLSVGDQIAITGILDRYYSAFWGQTLYEVLPRTPEDVGYRNLPLQYRNMMLWGGGILILFTIGWGVMLKRRVRARTRELSRAVKEKELLMKEMHHRVKNNLSVISGLLELQKMEPVESMEELIGDTQSRIRSISKIHEKLYQSDTLADVNMRDYIEEFADSVVQTFTSDQKQITLTKDLQSVTMEILQAVPLGLVVNELLNNAFKHGFADRGKGEIFITMKEQDEEVYVTVANNGEPLPKDYSLDNYESMGGTLIQTLTEQMGGTVEFTQNEWTIFRVTVPLT